MRGPASKQLPGSPLSSSILRLVDGQMRPSVKRTPWVGLAGGRGPSGGGQWVVYGGFGGGLAVRGLVSGGWRYLNSRTGGLVQSGWGAMPTAGIQRW